MIRRVLLVHGRCKATVVIIARGVNIIRGVTSGILMLGGKGIERCKGATRILASPRSPCAGRLVDSMPHLGHANTKGKNE